MQEEGRPRRLWKIGAYHFLRRFRLLYLCPLGVHFSMPLILVRILGQNRSGKSGSSPLFFIAYSLRRFFARRKWEQQTPIIYKKRVGQCFLAFPAREEGTKRPTGRMVERSGGVWCKLSRLGREIRAKRSEIGRERGEFCSWVAAIESKDWFICMQLTKPVFLSQSVEYELVVCCFSLC